MAKRPSSDAFVDLTADSDDDKSTSPPKKSVKRDVQLARAGLSPKKPFNVGATPAPPRSRELQAKLREMGCPEREIQKCIEKKDLVALHERYTSGAALGGAGQAGATPPTNPRPGSSGTFAKMERGASSAGAGSAGSALGAYSSSQLYSSIQPAIPVKSQAQSRGFDAFGASRSARDPYGYGIGALAAGAKSLVAGAASKFAAFAHPPASFSSASLAPTYRGGKCTTCNKKRRKCRCALAFGIRAGDLHGAGASRGMPYGGGAAGRGGDDYDRGPSHAEEQADGEVGLDHKDADEQTFTEYEPHTFSAPVFQKHPDPVVETASLSSLVPPKTTHKLRLCSKTITQGLLTNLQLETINLACQQHELRLPVLGSRAAFFMGDGPGVGKGRQASGIIMENYLQGRKRALWFSVSGDLVADARRDIAVLAMRPFSRRPFKQGEPPLFSTDVGLTLQDIGGGKIATHSLKDYPMGTPLEKQGVSMGILFCTYSLLIQEGIGARKKEQARLNQIVEWCGDDFEGALILDECHRAKNMGNGKKGSKQDDDSNHADLESWRKTSATKTATFVDHLQNRLPLARIVYLSATGASDPKHFTNMHRLGLWGQGTAFRDAGDFIADMHKGGIGAMELVAMHMKATGQYLARSLSFKDASFEVVEIKMSDQFKTIYNRAVEVWQKLISHPEWWTRESHNGGKPRNMMGLLWSAHLRFWAQMIMAAKVPEVTEIVKKALAEGMCCVIGLQSTGEAGSKSSDEDSADELFSNAANALLKLVEDYCNPYDKKHKKELIAEIKALDLPSNPLDDLIDRLGGPSMVAEMTGRNMRWVKSRGSWKLGRRAKGDRTELTVNIEERKAFQTGKKLVAIISEAASSGISLQADRRCGNQRRRVHITLQLPWASDQVVQQMGRSHRSNQSSAPMFKLVMTPIGGEWRFASAVARRLQALGALTQGDRRASGTGGASIQNFNIEQDYGLKALKELYQELEYGTPLTWNKAVPDFIIEAFPGRDQRDSIQKFLAEANDALEKAGFGMMQYNKAKTAKLKTFLNRIMGLKLDIQDLVFQYFMKLMNDRIGKDKASGEYQQSIVDISGSVIELSKLEDLFECPRTGAKAQRALLRTDRGVSWDKANEILSEHTEYVQELGIEDSVSGFYKSANTEDRVAGTTPVVLVLLQRTQQNSIKLRTRFYHVVRPNTGHSPQVYDLNHIRDNFMRATVESQSTKASWDRLHTFYERNCGHRSCALFSCSYKKRTTEHNLICGLVLPFWKDVKKIAKNVKVVRVQPTDGNKRLVGLRIWPQDVDQVCDVISRGSSDSYDDGKADDDRVERIACSAFHKVIKTCALHDCLNPAARDNVTFELPAEWNVDPNGGGKARCMVFIYEIPLQNALFNLTEPLRPARWKNDSQLYAVDARMQETKITVPTDKVAKNAIIAKPVIIDDYVREGTNTLRIHSIGERFCVVVRLVAERDMGAVLSEMSVVSNLAENLEWGKACLLKQLGGGDEDDDLVVTEIDVSLNDPLSCGRIKTPVRSKKCEHFRCFDLETFLQYGSRYSSFKCQICNKELNPADIQVCKRFEKILAEANPDADTCKLNKEFEITDAKALASAADKGKEAGAAGDAVGDKGAADEGGSGDKANADDDVAQVAPSGSPEEQLAATNLWEYTKEAEDFFSVPGISENAKAASPADDDLEDAQSSGEDAPVLAGRRRLRRRDSEESAVSSDGASIDEPLLAPGRVRPRRDLLSDDEEMLSDSPQDESPHLSSEDAGEMESTENDEEATTDDESGKGKGKGKASSSGKRAAGGSSSRRRPIRKSRGKMVKYRDADTDSEDESEDQGAAKDGDISDEY